MARGLVSSMDPNLPDNLIPPHQVAGFTKPIPDAHCRVEENCFKPTESCVSSRYHQPQLARKAFYSPAICDDAEQSVSLGCLEKR